MQHSLVKLVLVIHIYFICSVFSLEYVFLRLIENLLQRNVNVAFQILYSICMILGFNVVILCNLCFACLYMYSIYVSLSFVVNMINNIFSKEI